MFLLLCASACLCVCVCMSMRVFRFICKCVSVFVSLFVSVRACACVYVFVPACSCFWDDFQIIFIKFRDHFGSFLVAFWKWPLRGSRGHFHLVSNFISSLFLTPFCMPLGTHLGAKIAQVGAKMALSCPTWRQDVPKMANLEPKMANLAHFWEHLGDLFWILGAILPKMAKTKKTTTVHHF